MNLSAHPFDQHLLRGWQTDDASTPTAINQSAWKSQEKGEKILCAACRHPITSRNERIQVDDSHEHTFFNPQGMVFHLGCFRNAPGCILAGTASREFSWFKDHAWIVTGCGQCDQHLGWLFVHTSHNRFYGLILNRLREPDNPT